MSRKKKSDTPRLTNPVAFRLTEADHAAYIEKVEASGMKPSEFFRECVLTNRTQVVARQKNSADKQRLIYLFNKTSNNINQLAHRANVDFNAGTISEATYSGILNELELMGRYMKAVINDVD
ncbi:plasmid mobilization protein [Halomonas hibernica]|uniref:plasmid mobilization protein n=1 Tax=Halomonas hibernica TaxID=2591147 RepID=UPI001556F5F1|nr:plasmid mobilization relaxosome protein MobC [Halomonas hibernica]